MVLLNHIIVASTLISPLLKLYSGLRAVFYVSSLKGFREETIPNLGHFKKKLFKYFPSHKVIQEVHSTL